LATKRPWLMWSQDKDDQLSTAMAIAFHAFMALIYDSKELVKLYVKKDISAG